MRKLASLLAVAALFTVPGSRVALAQSSGNFSATGTPASCAIGTGGNFNGGTQVKVFSSDISTSNGSGVTLDIRPSLVTGLFTDTKISTTVPSATADVGIEVCVTVDGKSDGILPSSCVVYDERFQQISSNLFSQLTACTMAPTTTACTTDADCSTLGTGFTCSIAAGGTTGVCVGPNPLCDFDLVLSTLSAHSFDFVVPVGKGKPHRVEAKWSVIGTGATTGAHVASCVGPGILTVTQYKVFNNSGSLLSF
jgi:hypothetical protein